ncbi:hypothetical protein D9M70_613810 [compost metagenome]
MNQRYSRACRSPQVTALDTLVSAAGRSHGKGELSPSTPLICTSVQTAMCSTRSRMVSGRLKGLPSSSCSTNGLDQVTRPSSRSAVKLAARRARPLASSTLMSACSARPSCTSPPAAGLATTVSAVWWITSTSPSR